MQEKINIFVVAFITLICIPLQIHAQQNLIDSEFKALLQQLSPDSMYQHLLVLGNDSLKGRGTGSAGGDKAANYIAGQLHKIGLKPAGDNQTYFQNIPMHGSLPQKDSKLRLSIADTAIALVLWQDYILFNTGAQTFIPAPLPLVFVGYGILAPEFDYNDYQNLDVKNKIVVFLSGETYSNDPAFFNADLPTIYSDPVMKHRIALSRGARGSIMIPSKREDTYLDWSFWVRQFRFEDVRLLYGITDNLNVLINFFKAPTLFKNAKYSFEDVLAFDSAGTMRSFPLEVSVSFQGNFKERDFISQNVVGMLEGQYPLQRDSYVIIAAHYDHLGVGTPVAGDSIYNGVVDNAMGVAATLELARGFRLLKNSTLRSLIFLFLTGEEKGLLGSKYYCDQPVVPLHKTIATINIDGIAILDRLNSVTGIGGEHSTLSEILEDVARELNIKISDQPAITLAKDPLLSSDQFSFAQAGIPAILVMEGLDYQNLGYDEGRKRFFAWGQKIYHSPFDDLHQGINKDAMLQHTQILFAFINAVANAYITPQWLPGSEFINARLQSIAEKR